MVGLNPGKFKRSWGLRIVGSKQEVFRIIRMDYIDWSGRLNT